MQPRKIFKTSRISMSAAPALVALVLGTLVAASPASAGGEARVRLDGDLLGVGNVASGSCKFEKRGSGQCGDPGTECKLSVQIEDAPDGTFDVVVAGLPTIIGMVSGPVDDLNLDSRRGDSIPTLANAATSCEVRDGDGTVLVGGMSPKG